VDGIDAACAGVFQIFLSRPAPRGDPARQRQIYQGPQVIAFLFVDSGSSRLEFGNTESGELNICGYIPLPQPARASGAAGCSDDRP
jgi:hypothetical protein